MATFDLKALLTSPADPEQVVRALREASGRLELPVRVDLRLHELLDAGAAPQLIVSTLAAMLLAPGQS